MAGLSALGATYFSNAYNLSGEEGCYSFAFDTSAQQLTIGLIEIDGVKESTKADFRKEERREERCKNCFCLPLRSVVLSVSCTRSFRLR